MGYFDDAVARLDTRTPEQRAADEKFCRQARAKEKAMRFQLPPYLYVYGQRVTVVYSGKLVLAKPGRYTAIITDWVEENPIRRISAKICFTSLKGDVWHNYNIALEDIVK